MGAILLAAFRAMSIRVARLSQLLMAGCEQICGVISSKRKIVTGRIKEGRAGTTSKPYSNSAAPGNNPMQALHAFCNTAISGTCNLAQHLAKAYRDPDVLNQTQEHRFGHLASGHFKPCRISLGRAPRGVARSRYCPGEVPGLKDSRSGFHAGRDYFLKAFNITICASKPQNAESLSPSPKH